MQHRTHLKGKGFPVSECAVSFRVVESKNSAFPTGTTVVAPSAGRRTPFLMGKTWKSCLQSGRTRYHCLWLWEWLACPGEFHGFISLIWIPDILVFQNGWSRTWSTRRDSRCSRLRGWLERMMGLRREEEGLELALGLKEREGKSGTKRKCWWGAAWEGEEAQSLSSLWQTVWHEETSSFCPWKGLGFTPHSCLPPFQSLKREKEFSVPWPFCTVSDTSPPFHIWVSRGVRGSEVQIPEMNHSVVVPSVWCRFKTLKCLLALTLRKTPGQFILCLPSRAQLHFAPQVFLSCPGEARSPEFPLKSPKFS